MIEIIIASILGGSITGGIFIMNSVFRGGKMSGQVDINTDDIDDIEDKMITSKECKQKSGNVRKDIKQLCKKIDYLRDDIKDNSETVTELETKVDMMLDNNSIDHD